MSVGRSVIEIILKGVDQASNAFKSADKSAGGFSKTLKTIGKDAAKVSIGVAVVGVAMKKAFDLGREGAAILQTDESFGLLMEKVGAAPDLFDQLTTASHGTLTEFELQSSTMTLLAGASGDLATQLANATPQLLEIAKASNKLNPSLGTTAFMYESIATGVKRAQPLILDNLGLTLKVGAANEAYAAILGKTVEAMTAEEKSIAILNATLKAGDVLIDQVGGSTEALTDSFDQVSTAIRQAVDDLKTKWAPELKKLLDTLGFVLTAGNKLDAVLLQHAKDVIDAGESYAFFTEEMERAEGIMSQELVPGADAAAQILDFFGLVTIDNTTFMEQYGDALFNVARETDDTAGASDELLAAIDALRPATETAITNQEALAKNLELSAEAADKAKKANKEFLDAIDRTIQSPIGDFIEDMRFFLATGGQFESAFERIKGIAAKAPEEALELGEALFAKVIDTQVELGNLSADEGIAELELLGMTAEEARDFIGGTDGIGEAMMGLDDINLELDSLRNAAQIAEFMLRDMQALSGTQWDIRATISGGGGFGDGGGGGGGSPTSEPDLSFPETQTGGQQEFAARGLTQNFMISDRFDLEEVVGEIATRVQEV